LHGGSVNQLLDGTQLQEELNPEVLVSTIPFHFEDRFGFVWIWLSLSVVEILGGDCVSVITVGEFCECQSSVDRVFVLKFNDHADFGQRLESQTRSFGGPGALRKVFNNVILPVCSSGISFLNKRHGSTVLN